MNRFLMMYHSYSNTVMSLPEHYEHFFVKLREAIIYIWEKFLRQKDENSYSQKYGLGKYLHTSCWLF